MEEKKLNNLLVFLKHAIFLNVYNNSDYAAFEKYLEGLNLTLKGICMNVA